MKTTLTVEKEDGGDQNTWAFSRQYYCYNGVSYKRLDNIIYPVYFNVFLKFSSLLSLCVDTAV